MSWGIRSPSRWSSLVGKSAASIAPATAPRLASQAPSPARPAEEFRGAIDGISQQTPPASYHERFGRQKRPAGTASAQSGGGRKGRSFSKAQAARSTAASP